jgi:transcriptional regulator with XRE-family HTH domain
MMIRSQDDLGILGRFLQWRRQQAGETVNSMSVRIGVDRSVVRSVEAGGSYRAENLVNYVEALGLELEIVLRTKLPSQEAVSAAPVVE